MLKSLTKAIHKCIQQANHYQVPSCGNTTRRAFSLASFLLSQTDLYKSMSAGDPLMKRFKTKKLNNSKSKRKKSGMSLSIRETANFPGNKSPQNKIPVAGFLLPRPHSSTLLGVGRVIRSQSGSKSPRKSYSVKILLLTKDEPSTRLNRK